jgi:5'-nucleotidase
MRGRMTAAGLAAVLVLAACGGDDSGGGDDTAASDTTVAPAEDTTTTTAAPETLRILVSNDDGYAAEGIDALVEGLLTLDDVEVTVSAPLENQSGTSDNTTPGQDEAVTQVETLSGYPATAVDGFPADSVEIGLAEMADAPPHLVVSGINEGQNIGPLTELSGTVGAARTAARAGIPALAVSQGLFVNGGPPPDYPAAVDLTLDWVNEHRDELVAAEPVDGIAEVTNLNVPTCPSGEQGELLEVPVATEAEVAGMDLGAVDCETAVADPTNDVTGFLAGHPVQSELTA